MFNITNVIEFSRQLNLTSTLSRAYEFYFDPTISTTLNSVAVAAITAVVLAKTVPGLVRKIRALGEGYLQGIQEKVAMRQPRQVLPSQSASLPQSAVVPPMVSHRPADQPKLLQIMSILQEANPLLANESNRNALRRQVEDEIDLNGFLKALKTLHSKNRSLVNQENFDTLISVSSTPCPLWVIARTLSALADCGLCNHPNRRALVANKHPGIALACENLQQANLLNQETFDIVVNSPTDPGPAATLFSYLASKHPDWFTDLTDFRRLIECKDNATYICEIFDDFLSHPLSTRLITKDILNAFMQSGPYATAICPIICFLSQYNPTLLTQNNLDTVVMNRKNAEAILIGLQRVSHLLDQTTFDALFDHNPYSGEAESILLTEENFNAFFNPNNQPNNNLPERELPAGEVNQKSLTAFRESFLSAKYHPNRQLAQAAFAEWRLFLQSGRQPTATRQPASRTGEETKEPIGSLDED